MESNRQDGWRKDRLGVIAPIGSGASWKELLKVSGDPAALAANMFTRARLPADSWPYLALATSIATYIDENGKRVIDHEHLLFCANMVGASVGKDGQGRDEALMGMTNIIAPAALSSVNDRRRDGDKAERLSRHNKVVEDEPE